ncbi:MAG: carbohydrate ABC transporter permease [Bacillota bacterium]
MVKSVRKTRLLGSSLAFIVIAIALVWTLYPLLWVVLSSFKPEQDQFAVPPVWLGSEVTLANYYQFFHNSSFLKALVNSTVITLSSTLLSLALGIPTAYGISRFKMRHKDAISIGVLTIRMLPPIVMVLPIFLLARMFRLLDTYTVMIVVGAFFSIPFVIWMMRGFFDEIPPELEEAAMVDGSSRTYAMCRVILPLTAPGIAATSVLTALVVWNEFLYALVLTGTNTRTLPVLVNSFVSEKAVSWGVMSAAGVVTALPLVLFALMIQKHLIRGLTAGSIK